MSDCDCSIEVTDKSQNGVLIKLLSINALMFIVELSIGWYAQSTGLIADAMDMLADAIVYGIGLYAVGKAICRLNSSREKNRVDIGLQLSPYRQGITISYNF